MAYRPDGPEHSRLFILAGRGIKEEVFRDAFDKYGNITDVWVVKDRRGEGDRGVLYITYSKASEAALALEEMNGRIVKGHPKPIKVILANSKRDGSVRDPKEDEKLLRLFIMVPKGETEEDLNAEFRQFGDLDFVKVLKDRNTGEPKGFGYVKYHRAYHAAKALEECDRKYKPKFAEPKMSKGERDAAEDRSYEPYSFSRNTSRSADLRDRGGYGGDSYRGDGGLDRMERGLKRAFGEYSGGYRDDYPMDRDDYRDSRSKRNDYFLDDNPTRSRYSEGPAGREPNLTVPSESPMDMLQSYHHTGCQRLHVTAPLGLTQSYLTKLFNLIPGLEYCDLNETTGVAYVRYSSPQCASYAKDKLDGFEYPIGSSLIVRFTDGTGGATGPPNLMSVSVAAGGYQDPYSASSRHEEDLKRKAAMILERSGINPDRVLTAENAGKERVTYCNLLLPLPQPMSPEDIPVMQRLFIVCQPSAVPERILRDAFSRFGNLIDVYLLSGRNYGYAKYASKDAAMQAIRTLHGQSIAGQRLKVLEAEDPKDEEEAIKRSRWDRE